MKHGHAIPKDKRPAMARCALEMFRAAPSRSAGLRKVQIIFDVSMSTARNLVGYGQWLERHPDEQQPQNQRESHVA